MANVRATRRQLGFFNNHYGERPIDAELHPTTLTDKPVSFMDHPGVTGIHWATQHCEKFLIRHSGPSPEKGRRELIPQFR
jgi:hypothetical protein